MIYIVIKILIVILKQCAMIKQLYIHKCNIEIDVTLPIAQYFKECFIPFADEPNK